MVNKMANKNETTPTAAVQGHVEITFLKEQEPPARKALGRGPGNSQWKEVVMALNTKPGKLALVFTSPSSKECFVRRTAVINAATALGIEMDQHRTVSREIDGKPGVYGVYAAVADDKTKTAQAAARKVKEANTAKLAADKGFKSIEEYKASLPKRGKQAAVSNGAAQASA